MAENAVDRRRRSTSLRRLLAILLGVIGLLVVALLIVASRQVSGSAAQTRAENRSASSFLLADSLRQSSNDLTNMVRLYVATGRSRYRAYYQQILAIRDGSSPRPRDYDSSFWDRVLANGEGSVRYGPALSLMAQMRAAHFAPDEFRALQAALSASNNLARLERSVMAAAARLAYRAPERTISGRRRASLPASGRPPLPGSKGRDHGGDPTLHRAGRFAHLARCSASPSEQPQPGEDRDRDPGRDRARRNRRDGGPHAGCVAAAGPADPGDPTGCRR